MSTASPNEKRFEWGVASRASPGQTQSGDLHLLADSPAGMFAAVVDGLGHGSEATAAAKVAIDTLRSHIGESVIALVQRCHHALKAIRGAVMTIVSFNVEEETVTALGVGNVEAVFVRADPDADPRIESLLLRPGLVGDRLPALHASVFPLHPGDVVILATDGVRIDFTEQLTVADRMQPMAERILRENFRGNDDALVLAVKYRGGHRG